MPEWELPETREWEEGATEVQQHLCGILGKRKWDVFKATEQIYLQNKVGYALFGPPRQTDDHQHVSYSVKQLKTIGKVCKTITKQTKHYVNKDRIPVAFLFIVTNIPDEPLVPVMRMPKFDTNMNSCYVFIDAHCRVYKSWVHFLKTNKLPKCLLVYPRDGIYSQREGHVVLGRARSPGWFTKNAKRALKASETLVSIGFAGVCMAALFSPLAIPAAPILVGVIARSVIAIGFTIHKLVDRGQHGQTLGLNSQEARGCWVGLASESLSTASGGVSAAAVLMTKASHTAVLVGHAGLRALRITKATVEALGVLNNVSTLAGKLLDGDEDITVMDAVQMASSILFFTHAVIPAEVAAGVVKALKDSKLPTVLSEVLRCVESVEGQDDGGEGKSIAHIHSAEQFVQLVMREVLLSPCTETDSSSARDFHLRERTKFVNSILASASHFKCTDNMF